MKKVNSPAPKHQKFISNKWLRRLALVLMSLFLLPAWLFTIGWFNRDLLIIELQDWYQRNHNGTLEIRKIDADFLRGFPNIGFTLRDIYQSNYDTISDTKSSIYIKQAKVTIGPSDLLAGDAKLKKINIDKAVIQSEVVSKRPYEYYVQLKNQKQNAPHKGIVLPSWINPEGTDFSVRELKFIVKDSILNKNFDLEVHEINGFLEDNNLQVTGELDMDITVNALGFNTLKGSYINGARVRGNPKFQINEKLNLVDLPEFILSVDDQVFKARAKFDFNDISSYNFSLQNENTNLEIIKGFLTDTLISKLSPYTIHKPFKTALEMTGKFLFRDTPDIYVEFSAMDNDVDIKDSLKLTHSSFNGYLTNNIYENDSIRDLKRTKKDIKIFFNDINAQFEDINFSATNSYFQNSPDAHNFINAKIKLQGPNETLAKFLNNRNFGFSGGEFKLEANILGDIPHTDQIFNFATGSFHLNDAQVVLKKNGLQLPIQTMVLKLDNENSILEELRINIPDEEDLILKGNLKNVSSLISNNPFKPTSSYITLDTRNLNVNKLIATAKGLTPISNNDRDDRKTLNETLNTIFDKFHPRFKLNLKTVEYKTVVLNDLNADVELLDNETISLNHFTFKYNYATTNLSGTLKVPESKSSLKEPIYIDFRASSSGSIRVFQDLFNIKLVDITAGAYQFSGAITGNVRKFEQLLNNAKGNLALKNAKFHYYNAALDIAFDSLFVEVGDSDINLNQVELEVGELYPFVLDGRVEQFPSFLLDNPEKKGKIFIQLKAPYIDGNQWMATLNSLRSDTPKQKLRHRDIYKVFKDINRLNPELKLSADSLKFRDIVTKDIKANVYFENDSTLKLDSLEAKYKDSKAVIKGTVYAQNIEQVSNKNNPFNFMFSAEAKGKTNNLNEYLKSTNFIFESGDFEFNGSYRGSASDSEIISGNAEADLKIGGALVNFEVADLRFPVDSLHLKIKNNLATLEALDIDLPGKSYINLTGSINNFSSFVDNSLEKGSHTSRFSVKSPYINSGDLKTFLKTSELGADSTSKKKFGVPKFKNALKKIYGSYYPSIRVNIDSFAHKSIEVSNFGSEIKFDSIGNFKIEDTNFNTFGGTVSMSVKAGSVSEDLPVDIDMEVKDIHVDELAAGMDYFNNDALRQAEKIDGNLSYTLSATGILNADGSLDMNSLNGSLHLNLKELELYNYKPIMENVPLLKGARFENLQFRPIEETFKIVNGELIIPRTQIQSSALQLFVEGQFRFGEYINVWLSLPWKNLKSNDGLILPEKQPYDAAGPKFYLQVIQDKNSQKSRKQKLRIRFKLGNRKMPKNPIQD